MSALTDPRYKTSLGLQIEIEDLNIRDTITSGGGIAYRFLKLLEIKTWDSFEDESEDSDEQIDLEKKNIKIVKSLTAQTFETTSEGGESEQDKKRKKRKKNRSRKSKNKQ